LSHAKEAFSSHAKAMFEALASYAVMGAALGGGLSLLLIWVSG